MNDLTCAGCSAPLDLSTTLPSAFSCACHHSGALLTDRVRAHGGFCGEGCRNLAARRRVARFRRCPACGKPFDDGHLDPETGRVGPGRPGVYCSEGCRTATERTRDLAMKELAKNKVQYRGRDAYVDAINRASDLLEFWCGRGATKPTEPPPPEARDALRERIEVLRQQLDLVDRELWMEDQNKLKQDRHDHWSAQLEKRAEADRAWREKLLK